MSGSSYQLPEPIDDTFLRSRWPLILSAGSGCPDLVLGLDWKILTKSFNSRVGQGRGMSNDRGSACESHDRKEMRKRWKLGLSQFLKYYSLTSSGVHGKWYYNYFKTNNYV